MKSILRVFSFLSLGILLFNNCQEKMTIDSKIPEIKLNSVEITSASTALGHFEILSNGGADIKEIGYCLSFSSNPEKGSYKTGAYVKEGKFEMTISGLSGKTTYYIKGFAANNVGKGYTEVLSFITPDATGKEVVTDADGNIYGVIKIGIRTWMAEDLRTLKFRNSDPIPLLNNTLSLSAGYIPANGIKYNWYAVKDIRNIAPEGWHVPAPFEFEEFINNLPSEFGFSYSGICEGGWWYSRRIMEGGYWTTSSTSNDKAGYFYSRHMGTGKDGLPLENGIAERDKRSGFSVRCVKNQ